MARAVLIFLVIWIALFFAFMLRPTSWSSWKELLGNLGFALLVTIATGLISFLVVEIF